MKFWLTVLRTFTPGYLAEEIEGDLLQRYERDLQQSGKTAAGRRLGISVVRFIRPGIILRNTFSIGLTQGRMLGNYFTIMIRNIVRKKLHAAINILGLTMGISFALLIGVFIWRERQVNQDLKDVNRLFLVENRFTGRAANPYFTPTALLPGVKDQYPGTIENYFRFLDRNITFSKGDKHFRIQSMIGDSTFLNMFGFRVVSGDRTTPLVAPGSVILTERVAIQFFGKTDVAGESLDVAVEGGGTRSFHVTAVIANPGKKNTVTDFLNMDAEAFLPLSSTSGFSMGVFDGTRWDSDIITYAKLSPGAGIIETAQLLNRQMKKEAPQNVSEGRVIELKPLSDYYRSTNHGAVQNLLISLMVIVAFLLVLAISNFVNISIAGSFSRLKEIGVRKVIGGLKSHVMVQFISESIFFSLLSGLLSFLVYELLRGYFSTMLDSDLPAITHWPPAFVLCALAGMLVIGILAGAYPSFFLSATKPIDSLKGKFKSVSGTIQFSKGLIATQFLISTFVFTAALVISLQISYFLNKDLGYDRSAVLIVTSAPRLWTQEGLLTMESRKRELLASPAVQAATLSTGSPAFNLSMGGDIFYQTGHAPSEGASIGITGADEDFLRVYGMKMAEGKFFDQIPEGVQSSAIVLTETAQKLLHVKIGDKVKMGSSPDVEFVVIGVLRDFNSETLHSSITPVAFLHNRAALTFRFFSFKLSSGDLVESVQQVERAWRKAFPEDAFLYGFADERLQMRYKTELKLKRASSLATTLMLIIVLTGVLGLVSLSIAKRTREIGIRKVLGASAPGILALLSREYAVIMGIAFAAGIPVSYWFAGQWLREFAYHIDLQWWMFALPVACLFTVTIVVVSAQAMTAAFANPVKALRNE